jgi:hypothetical protein
MALTLPLPPGFLLLYVTEEEVMKRVSLISVKTLALLLPLGKAKK